MKTVFAKHLPYKDGHLARVSAEMDAAGIPTIRVMKRGDLYFALEGSHRLFLCWERGIEPKLVIETIDTDPTLESYWQRIAATLPRYDFKHVQVLDLAAFEETRPANP